MENKSTLRVPFRLIGQIAEDVAFGAQEGAEWTHRTIAGNVITAKMVRVNPDGEPDRYSIDFFQNPED